MKIVIFAATLAFAFSAMSQTNRIPGNRSAQEAIQFEVVGRLTHRIESGNLLRPTVIVLMEMVKSGVRFQVKTFDPLEVSKIRQIVSHLYANLPNANYRIFKKDENNLLITTGMRHAPTDEERQAILLEIMKVVKGKVGELGLRYSQNVSMN